MSLLRYAARSSASRQCSDSELRSRSRISGMSMTVQILVNLIDDRLRRSPARRSRTSSTLAHPGADLRQGRNVGQQQSAAAH
jgi:hypothetical protein